MNRSLFIFPLVMLAIAGCAKPDVPYGRESQIILSTSHPHTWAIAPAVNLSGQRAVDPILQADLLYQQLQQVRGLTVIPVDRVVPILLGMRTEQLQSPQQAVEICHLLQCDGLIVPTITAFDSYNPPKIGASLQLFTINPQPTTRPATQPSSIGFIQFVGMYDAANGTTHDEVIRYAAGRYDPKGAFQEREYFVNMDRYNGFVYRKLIEGILDQMFQRQ